jgi:hypothetical protein
MATTVVNALNGSAPERTPTITITQVTISGLDHFVDDVFVVDRGSTGDPIAGANSATLSQTPLSGAPFMFHLNGARLTLNRDFSLNGTTVTLLNAVTFLTSDTLSFAYFKSA